MSQEYVIALYLRVSIEDKKIKNEAQGESHSITSQRELLLEFIQQRKEFFQCKIIELCDDGYSGVNFQRPGIQKLLQMTKEGAIQCILVKDFSRFGRDYLIVSDYIEQIFPFLGVRFIAVNDNYDSKKYEGMTLDMDMAFCNIAYGWYSRDISEKEKSAKRVKAMNGEFLSAFAPIGYQKDSRNKNHLVVEEESAKIVRKIFTLAGTGMQVREIANILNTQEISTPSAWKKEQGKWNSRWKGVHGEELWDISSVTRILRDERYLGINIYGRRSRIEVGNSKTKKRKKEEWIRVSHCHEAIVTKEEFEAAQKMLKNYRERKERRKGDWLFQGKLRCGICRYALIGRKRNDKQKEYYCQTWKRGGKFDCQENVIKERELAETVEQIIFTYEKVFGKNEIGKGKIQENLEEKAKKIKEQMRTFQSAYHRLEEQKARAYEKMVEKELNREQYTKKYNKIMQQEKELEQEEKRLKKKLELLGQEQTEMQNLDKIGIEREEIKDSLIPIRNRDRDNIVEIFVDCIYGYRNNKIKILWRFL